MGNDVMRDNATECEIESMGDTGLEPVTPSVSCDPRRHRKQAKTPDISRFYTLDGRSQAVAENRVFSRKIERMGQ